MTYQLGIDTNVLILNTGWDNITPTLHVLEDCLWVSAVFNVMGASNLT